MITRRLARSASQLVLISITIFVFVFFLDRQFRVLPNSLHNRLPHHHIGHTVVDIQVSSCTKLSGCHLGGSWERIYKDLFLQDHYIRHGYVHYKVKKRKDLDDDAKVVLDVQVSRREPEKAKDGEWEQRKGGLWVKRGKIIDDSVTAVDVLFGPDAVDPRPGWEIKGTLSIGKEARITIKKGSEDMPPKKPELRMRKDGMYKIVQIADIHLATGIGVCRDPVPAKSSCDADPRTIEFLETMLDDEKPDLAIFTGDQVNGQTAPDAQTALFKFVEVCVKRKIPYATIYGNHDDEGSLTRAELMELTQRLPYSLSEPGPSDVPGVGNYYLQVLAHKTDHPAMTLYFLDTHAYSPDEKHYKGYAWIKPEQIEWFRDTVTALQPMNKQYAYHHLNMAFIHIPLPEYRITTNYFKGEWREAPTAPYKNTNFKDALIDAGVDVVTCGHDHANDYCMLDKKDGVPSLWMCYGGGAGFGGYGGYNSYIRRMRFFEIDAHIGRITTWKRREYNDTGKIDEQILVDAGKSFLAAT